MLGHKVINISQHCQAPQYSNNSKYLHSNSGTIKCGNLDVVISDPRNYVIQHRWTLNAHNIEITVNTYIFEFGNHQIWKLGYCYFSPQELSKAT